jgi:hypothetical protein
MAIRNTAMGGTDFYAGEPLYDHDLNDTFDEIARLVDNGN